MTLSTEAPLLLPIAALLPLTAILLVSQSNPYQTLVLRGILGSVAALLYALLGAADVAITEVLVGTLLSTTLYAVALRSSMVVRLACPAAPPLPEGQLRLLETWLAEASLRLELVSDPAAPPHAPPGDLHGLLACEGAAEGEGAAIPGVLQLRSPRLLERLGGLAGAAAWREAGHRLELLP
ncbi:MAG: hydrogenase subunit MbhD domain-containing protein [Synechococcus sp.]|nr:hydrogenase subunit MbhD domain-containing protein [Synechococcus sp.]